MNSLQGVTPSFEISVMQFSKTTFIKLFVTLGYAFVGYFHRFRRRTCHTVGELIQDTPYMNRQPAAVFIICLVAEQIEKLALEHGDHEIKGGVRVAHNEEQSSFSVAQGIKFQIIILHQIPQFLNIEWGKPGSAANQDGLCRFARDKLSRTF